MPAASPVGFIHSPEVRVLENTLLTIEVAVLGWLLVTEGPAGLLTPVLFGAGAVALSLLVTKNWPLGAIFALVAGSAIPRFAGSLFGLHVRPEHVAIGAVLLAVVFRFGMGQVGAGSFWWAADYLLATYVFVNFFTSTFSSLDPSMTLRWAAMNAIVIGAYFLMRLLVTGEPVLYRVFDLLLWAGALESTYGIICFLSNRAFGTQFGIAEGQYGLIPGTHGTQYEANLFGSYTACCAVMFLTVYLLGRGSRRSIWTPLGLALCAAGTLVSLARAALVALCLVALLVFVMAVRKGQLRVRRLLVVGCSVAILLLVISPFIGSFLQQRFSTIDLEEVSTDSSAWFRIVSLGAAIDDIQAHPVLGMGTDSLQLTFNMRDYTGYPTEMDDEPGWISNSPVRVLHDTGVIGLGIFLAFLITLAVATIRAIRLAEGPTRSVVVALAAGLLVYAVTFQVTEATLLAFPWVHVGLLAATVGVIRRGGALRGDFLIAAGRSS